MTYSQDGLTRISKEWNTNKKSEATKEQKVGGVRDKKEWHVSGDVQTLHIERHGLPLHDPRADNQFLQGA